MTFGQALEELKKGKKIRRSIWGGFWFLSNVEIEVYKADDRSDYLWEDGWIVAKLKDGGYAPAQPYQADILAEDWLVVE